jgi:hypothetical protein
MHYSNENLTLVDLLQDTVIKDNGPIAHRYAGMITNERSTSYSSVFSFKQKWQIFNYRYRTMVVKRFSSARLGSVELLKLILYAVLPKGKRPAGPVYTHNNIFDSHSNSVSLTGKRCHLVSILTAQIESKLQTLDTKPRQILLIKLRY